MITKKFFASALVITSLVPFAVSAQSADDVILNLLSSLDAPLVLNAPATVNTATTAPVKTIEVKKTDVAATVPVLNSNVLFDLDANTVKPDPKINELKATLAAILAEFASYASKATTSPTTVVASTTASSSAAVVVSKQTYLRDLTVGSRGADVRALQTLLIGRGFLFGDATGYFGVLTKTAVLAFQSDMGLPSVGNVGPRTRALLNSIPQDSGASDSPRAPVAIGPIGVATTASSTSMSMQSASSTDASSTPSTWGKPVSVSMTILPTEAPVGGAVSVTWLSQNADSCEASDGWGGPRPTIGAAIIEPLEFSLNFVMTCTGAGGVASTSALVVVGSEE